jgi:nicotinate phosphoribosyltransferase
VKAEILQCLYKKAYCNNTLTRFYNMSSNVAAGWLFGIPIRGTHSHAFVSSFMGLDDIIDRTLASSDGSNKCEDFVSLVQNWLARIKVYR